MKTETKVQTIDVTPTIMGTMQMYIMLLESGNAEGKALARQGAMDIARKLSLALTLAKEAHKEKNNEVTQ
jgi:hypothetical protein